MMKKMLIALIAIALMAIGSIALAGEAQSPGHQTLGPVLMTDTQMDNVVAGSPNGEGWGWRTRNSGTYDDWTVRIWDVPGEEEQGVSNAGSKVGNAYTGRPNQGNSSYGYRSNGNKDNAIFN